VQMASHEKTNRQDAGVMTMHSWRPIPRVDQQQAANSCPRPTHQ
jgi:hypothetical protein